MRKRRAKIQLVAATRPDPDDDALDYAAFYDRKLTATDALVLQVMEWARARGAGVSLVEDGRPFVGMCCNLSFSALTVEEVADFRGRFVPSMDSAIPIL